MRQVDMLQDGISKSSATLSRMAKKLRHICLKSMRKHRKQKGQRIGGVDVLIHIDESKFCHKRKVCILLLSYSIAFKSKSAISTLNLHTEKKTLSTNLYEQHGSFNSIQIDLANQLNILYYKIILIVLIANCLFKVLGDSLSTHYI